MRDPLKAVEAARLQARGTVLDIATLDDAAALVLLQEALGVSATGARFILAIERGTLDGDVVASEAPEEARARARLERRASRYPTLESIGGAAGTLPEPRPWKKILADARAERLARMFPPPATREAGEQQRRAP